MKMSTNNHSSISPNTNVNLTYSESVSVRDELEGAISKITELLDEDIFDECMKDIESVNSGQDFLFQSELIINLNSIKDRFGIERTPLAEKEQNTVILCENEASINNSIKSPDTFLNKEQNNPQSNLE